MMSTKGSSLVWKAPGELPFGQLSVLTLEEENPASPALPRPGDDKLGTLHLRAAEPIQGGRAWKLTVQPLRTGIAIVPSMDMGDGRRSPELRIMVPRTTFYGEPWVGVGGGREDVLPMLPFPWAWASLLLLPVLLLAWLLVRWRMRGAPARREKAALRHFSKVWPPRNRLRPALDEAHARGRDLLAARFGEESKSWNGHELSDRGLAAWKRWAEDLDAARFGDAEPSFVGKERLVSDLEARR